MIVRTYESPSAFKQALEQRLRDSSLTGVDFARRRQLLVFDRFLARIGQEFGDAVTLKGGLVLELRLERARTTKDIDLRMLGSPADLMMRLEKAAKLDLGDFMTFDVQPDAEHPEIQADGMQYDGLRFRTECKIASKLYGQVFGLDVAFGDPLLGDPDVIVADDSLAFAGIAPPMLRLYPVETHIAEKLHAYTIPRLRPNSRVKDLPDLALLGTVRALDASRLRTALEQTFSFRSTHPLPPELPEPPASWTEAYARIAGQDSLRWSALRDVFEAAAVFLDPMLSGVTGGAWDPTSWSWM